MVMTLHSCLDKRVFSRCQTPAWFLVSVSNLRSQSKCRNNIYPRVKSDCLNTLIYCDVPCSPCLSKMGSVYGPFFFLKFLGSIRFSPPVNGPKDPWPRVLSLPRVRVVCWRPLPTGTRQYYPCGTSTLGKVS